MASTTAGAGFALVAAASPVRWAGNRAQRRTTVYWLPRQEVPIVGANGLMNMEWYRFFTEVSRRLAGVEGPSLTDVQTTTSGVQQAVLDAAQAANDALALATATDARVDVVKDVAVNAGLSGAGNIP